MQIPVITSSYNLLSLSIQYTNHLTSHFLVYSSYKLLSNSCVYIIQVTLGKQLSSYYLLVFILRVNFLSFHPTKYYIPVFSSDRLLSLCIYPTRHFITSLYPCVFILQVTFPVYLS